MLLLSVTNFDKVTETNPERQRTVTPAIRMSCILPKSETPRF